MFRFPNWSANISSDPPVFSAYSTANFSTYGATDIKTYTSKWSAYGTANQAAHITANFSTYGTTKWSALNPAHITAN